MVKQLIYKSQSVGAISADLMESILAYARRYNANHAITGLLLCSDDVFLQFIEGPPAEIDQLFKRLSQDPRHQRLTLLYTGYADERAYPKWQMMSYSTDQMLALGASEAYILAQNLMDPTSDESAIHIGAFMKTFCEAFLPVKPPTQSDYN